MTHVPQRPQAALRLSDIANGREAVVLAIDTATAPPDSAWSEHLHDLGFASGERVMVMHRGWPGGDPLVVRVGVSTYALRRAEAACIAVGLAP